MVADTKLKELEEPLEEPNDPEERRQRVALLEHDIECPRCHDTMSLCSDFDSLHYSCEACDFTLHTIKK